MPHTNTIKTENRDGMTLDELATWIQDQLRNNTPGDTPVQATVTFKGRIKSLTITTP